MTDVVALRGDVDEEKVWAARLHGISVRRICREFGLVPKEVHRICDARVPQIDDALRRRVLGLELSRLDKLYGVAFARAMAGDMVALLACLRISERRSAYLNLDHAPSRQDQPTVVIAATPAPSSTERIRQALALVRAGGQQQVLAGPTNGEADPA